ncbi:hypothetical protein DFH09DRAFT_1404892 [Mycena vulgaris]|nr:hypothetical protein DFH09DRAFT_1404892 [Mycena vulgaris]
MNTHLRRQRKGGENYSGYEVVFSTIRLVDLILRWARARVRCLEGLNSVGTSSGGMEGGRLQISVNSTVPKYDFGEVDVQGRNRRNKKDSPSTRPNRVFTPQPLRTSSLDDDDNGTEQHDRPQGLVLTRVRRAAYRPAAAPVSPFDATPQPLIPRHREHPAPGPARRRKLADPPRTQRVDTQARTRRSTAAPSRQRQCGDPPPRPLPTKRVRSSRVVGIDIIWILGGILPSDTRSARTQQRAPAGTYAPTSSYARPIHPARSSCSPRTSARPLIMPPPNSHSRSYPQHGGMTSTHPAPRAPFLCASRALPAPLVAPLLALWRGCIPTSPRTMAGCRGVGVRARRTREMCMRLPHPPAHVEGRLHGACVGSSEGGNYTAQRDRAGRRLHCGASCSPASPFDTPSANTTPTRAPQSATPRSPSSARRFYATLLTEPEYSASPAAPRAHARARRKYPRARARPSPCPVILPARRGSSEAGNTTAPGPGAALPSATIGLVLFMSMVRNAAEGRRRGGGGDHLVVECLQLGLPTSTRVVSSEHVVAGACGGWAADSESLRAVHQNCSIGLPFGFVVLSLCVPRCRCYDSSACVDQASCARPWGYAPRAGMHPMPSTLSRLRREWEWRCGWIRSVTLKFCQWDLWCAAFLVCYGLGLETKTGLDEMWKARLVTRTRQAMRDPLLLIFCLLLTPASGENTECYRSTRDPAAVAVYKRDILASQVNLKENSRLELERLRRESNLFLSL